MKLKQKRQKDESKKLVNWIHAEILRTYRYKLYSN